MEQGRRIDWCDIFKGIVIILVVVGHATSRFNQYIYQFHMAAFFFISGYTGKGRKSGSVFEEICKKMYKWMVPYFTINLAGIWLFWLFHKAGILGAVSTIQYPARFQDALFALCRGTVYCDWLGAMWFLPVLFFATILFRILIVLCRKDLALAAVSFLIFLCAMKLARSGKGFYYMDLAGIAQVYLTEGYLARKIQMREQKAWRLLVRTILLGAGWWESIRLGMRYVVDWPSRSFNGAGDLMLPLFGILLTIELSRLLAKNAVVKKLLVCLGQNSMGVMCFHFIGFKAAYMLLILLGKMEWSDAYRLIPWSVVEDWWLLISAVAVVVSILLWRGLNRIPVVRVFIGGESAETVYTRMRETSIVGGIKAVYDFLGELARETYVEYRRFIGDKKFFKASVLICAAAVCAGAAAARAYGHIGPIRAVFPYTQNIITFQGGWLPQSDTEDYRWFERQGDFQVFITEQGTLEITGYIPDSIENCSYISIKLNDAAIYHQAASGGQLLEIRLDISEYVERYKVNIFGIETDGIRIAEKADADQRNLSALINSITIY